ncbi:MAG: methyltransferase domain-containing protein [Alphaproteobacteria bacterium]|nr:methyltransferase domain-containing protein [Alphaproteobacteria bacterium]
MPDFNAIKQHYDSLSPIYEAHWASYNQAQVDWVMAHWPVNKKPETVLDIGCGTGLMLEHIHQKWPGIELLGVDASGSMLQKAEGALAQAASFQEGNIEDGDFTAQLPPSDVVLSLSVSHHLNDIDRHIRLLHRLVGENGTVFLADFSLDGWGMKLAHRYVWPRGKTYQTAFPQWILMKKLAEKSLFSVRNSAILKPDWFWRIQIYELEQLFVRGGEPEDV